MFELTSSVLKAPTLSIHT